MQPHAISIATLGGEGNGLHRLRLLDLFLSHTKQAQFTSFRCGEAGGIARSHTREPGIPCIFFMRLVTCMLAPLKPLGH